MARRKSNKEQVVGGGRYTSKYPFSGMIECGICGGRLRRQVRTVGSGKKVASWGCATRIVNGRQACDSHHVNEDVLEATYLAALKDLIDNAGEVVEIVKAGVEMSMEPENAAALAGVEEEIILLQQAALDLHKKKRDMTISAGEYADRVKEYSDQMRVLEEKRDSLQSTDLKYAEVKTWLDTFTEQAMQEDALTAIDGVTLKMLVERIIARETGIEVVFKCGVSIEKEYVR